jgi:hypothetical protein
VPKRLKKGSRVPKTLDFGAEMALLSLIFETIFAISFVN